MGANYSEANTRLEQSRPIPEIKPNTGTSIPSGPIDISLNEQDVSFFPGVSEGLQDARRLQQEARTKNLTAIINEKLASVDGPRSPYNPTRNVASLKGILGFTNDLSETGLEQRLLSEEKKAGKLADHPLYQLLARTVISDTKKSDVAPENYIEELQARMIYLKMLEKYGTDGVTGGSSEDVSCLLLSIAQAFGGDEKQDSLYPFSCLKMRNTCLNLQYLQSTDGKLSALSQEMLAQVMKITVSEARVQWKKEVSDNTVTTEFTMPFVVPDVPQEDKNYQVVHCRDSLCKEKGYSFSWDLHFHNTHDLVAMVLASTSMAENQEVNSEVKTSAKNARMNFFRVIIQKLIEKNKIDQVAAIFEELWGKSVDEASLAVDIFSDPEILRPLVRQENKENMQAWHGLVGSIMNKFLDADARDGHLRAQQLFLSVIKACPSGLKEIQLDDGSHAEDRELFWHQLFYAMKPSDRSRLFGEFAKKDSFSEGAKKDLLLSEELISRDTSSGLILSTMVVEAWARQSPTRDYALPMRILAAGRAKADVLAPSNASRILNSSCDKLKEKRISWKRIFSGFGVFFASIAHFFSRLVHLSSKTESKEEEEKEKRSAFEKRTREALFTKEEIQSRLKQYVERGGEELILKLVSSDKEDKIFSDVFFRLGLKAKLVCFNSLTKEEKVLMRSVRLDIQNKWESKDELPKSENGWLKPLREKELKRQEIEKVKKPVSFENDPTTLWFNSTEYSEAVEREKMEDSRRRIKIDSPPPLLIPEENGDPTTATLTDSDSEVDRDQTIGKTEKMPQRVPGRPKKSQSTPSFFKEPTLKAEHEVSLVQQATDRNPVMVRQ